MENKDQKSKRISQNPSRRSIISLKDIPPLDPSSIPLNPSSLKPRRMMVPVCVNEVEEDNVNSTRSVSITQEKKLGPKSDEETKDESKKVSAKSVLNEICTSKRWKPPVYECCNAEGPSHMRLFTYKVVVETRESLNTTVLECFGDPKRTKKAAAEHAAEGAVWYLEHNAKPVKKPNQ